MYRKEVIICPDPGHGLNLTAIINSILILAAALYPDHIIHPTLILAATLYPDLIVRPLLIMVVIINDITIGIMNRPGGIITHHTGTTPPTVTSSPSGSLASLYVRISIPLRK